VLSLVKIGPVVLEKKIFKWPYPIITFLWLSPLWRGLGPFMWTNLNFLHPRIICVKFNWIWPAGFGEDFFKILMYFYSFAIISPWRRVISFIWTTWIPTTEGWFMPSLVKISQVVLEKKIFKWRLHISEKFLSGT
jgi:hypothetical protein